MSDYYTAKRTRNLFDPAAAQPFKLSRSKLELFTECPRCFYLDRRLGIGRPPGFPFSLNSAVDKLLKKEFDLHRAKNKVHPLLSRYGLKLVPFAHAKMDEWRENFQGVQFLHAPTNLIITGAVDDIWIDPATVKERQLYVVDYKSTSKDGEITALDQEWQDGYKRQMEIYQWLMRRNGFAVSNTGYFVYCNGRTDREAFDGRLEFEVNLIAYKGDDSWVEKTIVAARQCLAGDRIPAAAASCDYCAYVKEAGMV